MSCLSRRIVAQVDPSGKRTIGVLTKPDLINPGGEAEVLEVLSNNRKPLKLGYVMVKVMRSDVGSLGAVQATRN